MVFLFLFFCCCFWFVGLGFSVRLFLLNHLGPITVFILL